MRISPLQRRVMKIVASFVVGAIVIDLASSRRRCRKSRSEVAAGRDGRGARAHELSGERGVAHLRSL
jgi:hypothetical protein